VRRCTGFLRVWADLLRRIVLDRGHHALLLRIPPFVGSDAVSVAVSTGEESGMPRSSAGIGVIVIAVGKVRPVIEKELEAPVAELVAIALEVISPELVDDDDDDQLGMTVVRGSGEGGGSIQNCAEAQSKTEKRPGRSGGIPHREGSLHRRGKSAKDRRFGAGVVC